MNKKGFTLAELLGVIVILLLLVLIVTPIAINYSKKASDSAYDIQVKTIKTSAREWAGDDDNLPLIPTEENGCIEVSLEKLKEAGYLDYNIKNPKTNEKFDDNLTVIIRREGKNLTYTFNEDGTQVCSTVVTTDYPKWIYISSSPSIGNAQTEVTVNIESNKKISEYNLLPENIQVKVGSTINDNANVTVYCNNGAKLSCELKLSNLEGDGKVALVIDKDVMKDEDLNPSRLTSIITDTIIDTKGPVISYTGRTNTNPSLYYATKDDTVEVMFKAEDEQGIVNNLTKDDIKVYLDGIEITCDKVLTTSGSGNSLSYVLKLTNVTGSGKLSIKIPSGKVADSLGNTNNEKTITPGITFDNIKPTITFDPNEEARYLQSITPMMFVTDNETGVDDSTIKYIVSTDSTATPNNSISNGGEITISGLTGNYYIIGYACDYAGNCDKVSSGIYHMNNVGPMIEISPNSNAGYARTADIKIIVTPRGAALDEGSFVYALSTDVNATPTAAFINNTYLNIPALTGVYYVNAKACDMDGNCSEAVSNKYYFDNQAPDITYNPNGTYNTSTGYFWTKALDVNINVEDNVELDWSKYVVSTTKTYNLDNSSDANINTIPSGSTTSSISGLTGTYYIITKGCDALGNCRTSVSDKYQFDNTNPECGTVSVNKTNGKATMTATDNVALKKYEVYSGSTSLATTNISGTSAGTTYTSTTGGTYKFKVYDHLDNTCEVSFKLPYTVSFDANGGSGGQSADVKATNGEAMPTISTTKPTRDGYTFQGWYDNANYAASGAKQYYTSAGASARNYDKSSNTTLYAGWSANTYTVKFNGNSSTGGSTDDQAFTYGTAQKLRANGFTRTGHSFAGWNTKANGSGTSYADKQNVNNLTTTNNGTFNLYAQWTIHTNTLTVNPNGGKVTFNGAERTASTSVTKNYNETISVPNASKANTSSSTNIAVSFDSHGGSAQSTQNATKTTTKSYTFNGWDNSGTCGSMSGTTYRFPGNNGTTCTKKASWVETSSTSTSSITLPTPTRGGFTFQGWYDSETGGTKIGNGGASYTPTAAITLHAHWTSSTVKVVEDGMLITSNVITVDSSSKKRTDSAAGSGCIEGAVTTSNLESIRPSDYDYAYGTKRYYGVVADGHYGHNFESTCYPYIDITIKFDSSYIGRTATFEMYAMHTARFHRGSAKFYVNDVLIKDTGENGWDTYFEGYNAAMEAAYSSSVTIDANTKIRILIAAKTGDNDMWAPMVWGGIRNLTIN